MTIRVLVTGFSVFPGAPVNPSERLIQLLRERRPDFGPDAVLETALLDTAYQTVGQALGQAAAGGSPDIAILFGLSRRARGFRLERAAKNFISNARPDVSGYTPPPGAICEGPESHSSNLPLDAIHQALDSRGLPVEFSDDAGDYLCNFTFYNARAGRFERFLPAMCGFVHVPYIDSQLNQVPDGGRLPRLTQEQLWTGALAIIQTSVAALKASNGELAGAMPA